MSTTVRDSRVWPPPMYTEISRVLRIDGKLSMLNINLNREMIVLDAAKGKELRDAHRTILCDTLKQNSAAIDEVVSALLKYKEFCIDTVVAVCNETLKSDS